MSNRDSRHQSLALSNEKKGRRKSRHCDLNVQESVICNDKQHGASIVSDRVIIPSSSQHLNLVGKALCRKHYNKLIVNAKKQKTITCSHPKHNLYIPTARNNKEGKKLKKAPERLIGFFGLPLGAKMCHHCLYET